MSATTAQLDLLTFKVPREHANVQWLINLLKDRGWMTRKEILALIQWPATESNIRYLRMLVSAAGPEIVKGQRGFNHIENADIADIRHAYRRAFSDGKENIRYSIALRRRAHQLIG